MVAVPGPAWGSALALPAWAPPATSKYCQRSSETYRQRNKKTSVGPMTFFAIPSQTVSTFNTYFKTKQEIPVPYLFIYITY